MASLDWEKLEEFEVNSHDRKNSDPKRQVVFA